MAKTLATVGILSIGDMGLGIARLLVGCGFRVVTNLEGRSADTATRARLASIEALPTDTTFVHESDYILSIVPPRDALATAKRIVCAFTALLPKKATPLYFLDLNAISPRSTREINDLFTDTGIIFIDGGIIGSPPSLKAKNASEVESASNSSSTPSPISISSTWNRPSIPTSGPHTLDSAPIAGATLSQVLNVKHVNPSIGAASGLKCCFATTTKGALALCIQAATTAKRLGVLDELETEMQQRIPGLWGTAKGVVNVPPKAYRWVREMEEIAQTHAEDGGFDGGSEDSHGIFDAVAEVYRTMAEDTVLGGEKIGGRKRGLTMEDVAECMGEGLEAKKRKKSA